MKRLIVFCLVALAGVQYSNAQSGIDSSIFVSVEKMPEFVGGEEAFNNFIISNIKYPRNSGGASVSGTVFISFIVERDGSVSNVKLLRGMEKVYDEEAIRVISQLPNYRPGYQNGKPQRVQFTVPIKFN